MSTPPNSNTTASSAANRVFAIPELLEMILLRLPATTREVPSRIFPPSRQGMVKSAATSILAIKRVSRSFNDTIESSPELQRRIKERAPLPLSRQTYHSSLASSMLLMDHGDTVRNAWMTATKYITDETTEESWRKMVVLGDIDFEMQVEFFLVDAGFKLRIWVQPGETFDKMVKTYRSALESKGLEPKETPEMFDERMARTAHEREEQFLAIADRMRRRREAWQAERDEQA